MPSQRSTMSSVVRKFEATAILLHTPEGAYSERSRCQNLSAPLPACMCILLHNRSLFVLRCRRESASKNPHPSCTHAHLRPKPSVFLLKRNTHLGCTCMCWLGSYVACINMHASTTAASNAWLSIPHTRLPVEGASGADRSSARRQKLALPGWLTVWECVTKRRNKPHDDSIYSDAILESQLKRLALVLCGGTDTRF
jgi:hypothetical protein